MSLTNHQPTDIPWNECKMIHKKVEELEEDSIKNKNNIDTSTTTTPRGHDDDDDDDDSNDDLFAMFADPDPYETFRFSFLPSGVIIELHGHKQENGQTLSSTGLTLWRASEWLCRHMIRRARSSELIQGKRVLELGAGLGLCGIVAHQLGAKSVLLTDGDVDTLINMRKNVEKNRRRDDDDDHHHIDCPQLIWGYKLDDFIETHGGSFDVLIASDIIYVPEIIEPLWETVSALLLSTDDDQGIFLLSYARRNVPIDLVLEEATKRGFEWTWTSSSSEEEDDDDEGVDYHTTTEGVFTFSKVQ